MEHTISLKQNHVFRRLYSKGKSAVNPCLALYCRKNNSPRSRLSITVGVKVGSLFGAKYKSRAELVGGIILILMGLKILLEHLGLLP